MKTEFKRLFLIVLFTISAFQFISAGQETIRRHYIIAVDQTIQRPQNVADVERIYKSLCDWLNGKMPNTLNTANSTIPEPVKFDPVHDAVSLFAFGLAGKTIGDYNRIHSSCFDGRLSERDIFNDILHSWIKERGRYVYKNDTAEPQESFSNFLESDFHKLFDGTGPKCQRILDVSGITLSHYVYPLILSFISKEETANEYYLIVVSDFQSGLHSNNDTDDRIRLNELTSKSRNPKYSNFFIRQVNEMKAPFIQADYFDLNQVPSISENMSIISVLMALA